MASNRSLLSTLLVLAAFCGTACSSGGDSASPAAGQVQANAQGLFAGELISNTGVSAGLLNLQVPAGSNVATVGLSGTVDSEISGIPVSGTTLSHEVPVPGLASGVLLQAKFDGSSWVGTLSTPASKTSYSFKASQGFEAKIASGVERLAPEGVYEGKFAYPSGGKRAAKIIVEATSDLGEQLLALFTPQTAASIQVVYDGGSKESVSDAVWNSDQRTLLATGPAMTSMGAPQLQCVFDELENLDCVLAMGKQSVGKGKFVRKSPPKPKKPQATPAPTPSPVPVQQQNNGVAKNLGTERTFVGRATFRDSLGKTQSKDVSVQVTLIADIQGPAAAKVVFRVRGSRVGANFRMGVYDSIEKSLRAEERLSMGALAGSLVLQCQGFDFKASPYSFTCDYESTTTGVSGRFVMSGK